MIAGGHRRVARIGSYLQDLGTTGGDYMEEMRSQDDLAREAVEAETVEFGSLREEAPVQPRRESFMENTATVTCVEYVCQPSL